MEVSRGRFGVPKWVEQEEGNKVEKKWPQEAPGREKVATGSPRNPSNGMRDGRFDALGAWGGTLGRGEQDSRPEA